MTALEKGWNKIEEERLERSSLKKGDGRVIHLHPLFAAPDLEETFGLEEQEGGWRVKRGDE